MSDDLAKCVHDLVAAVEWFFGGQEVPESYTVLCNAYSAARRCLAADPSGFPTASSSIAEQLARLRWGVLATDDAGKQTLVMACISRRRAEGLAILGNDQSPGLSVSAVELHRIDCRSVATAASPKVQELLEWNKFPEDTFWEAFSRACFDDTGAQFEYRIDVNEAGTFTCVQSTLELEMGDTTHATFAAAKAACEERERAIRAEFPAVAPAAITYIPDGPADFPRDKQGPVKP